MSEELTIVLSSLSVICAWVGANALEATVPYDAMAKRRALYMLAGAVVGAFAGPVFGVVMYRWIRWLGGLL